MTCLYAAQWLIKQHHSVVICTDVPQTWTYYLFVCFFIIHANFICSFVVLSLLGHTKLYICLTDIFGIYPNEAGGIKIIIFLKLAGSEAHLRPSCSPVTRPGGCYARRKPEDQVALNNQGGGQKGHSWQCGRNNTFSNIIFISIFQDSNVAGL